MTITYMFNYRVLAFIITSNDKRVIVYKKFIWADSKLFAIIDDCRYNLNIEKQELTSIVLIKYDFIGKHLRFLHNPR